MTHRTRRRRTAAALAAACILVSPDAHAQSARDLEVVVENRVHVSADRAHFPHVEAHLAASRSQPTYMVGAVIAFTPEAQYVPRLVAYTSHDGGRRWTHSDLPQPEHASPSPWPAFLDPWTTIADDGTAYVSGLRMADQSVELYVWRSRDGGRQWDAPVLLPRGEGGSFDHPVILATGEARAGGGAVYVFANQAARGSSRGAFGNSLLRSTDHGATFASPVMILPNTFNNQNGNLVTFSDGSLMAAWFEIGATGSPEIRHRRLWASVSADSGRTFLPPRLAVESYAGSWPILDVDRSDTPRKDRVYAAWVGMKDSSGTRDDRPFAAWSDDRGAKWSVPKPVSRRSRARGNPMMAVSPEGTVGMSWYDWDGSCAQLVFAASADHGETFSDPTPVSPKWCVGAPQPGNRVRIPGRVTVRDRWPTGGDYHGLVAAPGREFRVLWVDGSSGVFQVHAAAIRVGVGRTR
jgi:hypothetical protein